MTDRVNEVFTCAGCHQPFEFCRCPKMYASSNRVCICGAPLREGDWFRREVNKPDECSHATRNREANHPRTADVKLLWPIILKHGNQLDRQAWKRIIEWLPDE